MKGVPTSCPSFCEHSKGWQKDKVTLSSVPLKCRRNGPKPSDLLERLCLVGVDSVDQCVVKDVVPFGGTSRL